MPPPRRKTFSEMNSRSEISLTGRDANGENATSVPRTTIVGLAWVDDANK
jgi:hypothetical protein